MANELTETQITSLDTVRRRINEAVCIPVRELNRESIDDYLDEAEESVLRLLEGAGPDKIARGISFTAKMLGCKDLDSFLLKGFQKILSSIPNDLWERGVLKLLETHTYCKMPTPGEFLSPIRVEWYERKDLLKRIQLHKSRLQLSDTLNDRKPSNIKMLS